MNTPSLITGICRAYTDFVVALTAAEHQHWQLEPGHFYKWPIAKMNEFMTQYKSQSAHYVGGATANTLAHIARFGGKTHFIAKLASDDLGKRYQDDLSNRGIGYSTPLSANPRDYSPVSIIVLSPNSERTVIHNKGVADQLSIADIKCSSDALKASRFLILNDILRKPEKSDIRHAVLNCTDSTCQIVTTLQALDMTEHFKAQASNILLFADIIFGNQQEYQALLHHTDFANLQMLSARYPQRLFFRTRGADGAELYVDAQRTDTPACKIDNVCDTTGAGDAFVGGVLYKLSKESTYATALLQGACWAEEMLAVAGGRPPL